MSLVNLYGLIPAADDCPSHNQGAKRYRPLSLPALQYAIIDHPVRQHEIAHRQALVNTMLHGGGILERNSGDVMKTPVKAGREWRMQERHEKGMANHLDSESYAGAGNSVGEALTGAHAGQPWSSEITSPGVPTL